MKTIFAAVAVIIGLTAGAQTQPGFGLPVVPDKLDFDFAPVSFDDTKKTGNLIIVIDTNIPSVVMTLWDPNNPSQDEKDHRTQVLHGESSFYVTDVPYVLSEFGARVFSISVRNVLNRSYVWKRESRSLQSIVETK